jgi:hypothetical protein
MWVRKENFVADKIEFYDRADRLAKRLVCSSIEKIDGY